MTAVTFWTLNPNLPPSKIAEAASELMEKGLFPVKASKICLVSTSRLVAGVTITELKDGYDAGKV